MPGAHPIRLELKCMAALAANNINRQKEKGYKAMPGDVGEINKSARWNIFLKKTQRKIVPLW